jgi:hypothetical protein
MITMRERIYKDITRENMKHVGFRLHPSVDEALRAKLTERNIKLQNLLEDFIKDFIQGTGQNDQEAL